MTFQWLVVLKLLQQHKYVTPVLLSSLPVLQFTALLTRLRAAGYRLACLSNSNAAHWERSAPMRWLQQQLDVAISSHQLGLRKPDPAIFAVALDRLGAPADAVGYFDDLAANVAAATAAGLRAHHVDGIDALHARLAALGWLDD